jgi:hypothetical protein
LNWWFPCSSVIGKMKGLHPWISGAASRGIVWVCVYRPWQVLYLTFVLAYFIFLLCLWKDQWTIKIGLYTCSPSYLEGWGRRIAWAQEFQDSGGTEELGFVESWTR